MTGSNGAVQPLPIAIGLTNPEIGSNKASASFSSDPQAAYDSVTDGSTQAQSAVLQGRDTNANATTIQFLLASAAGTSVSVTLTEQIVTGGS